MKGAQVHGGMVDLYEVAKRHREELVREAKLNRLAKRLRAARKRRAGMSCASILMGELGRDARRLLELLRIPTILMLAFAAYSSVWREP